jgi:hypothetical protein
MAFGEDSRRVTVLWECARAFGVVLAEPDGLEFACSRETEFDAADAAEE